MTVHKYSPTRARGISEFSTGHGIVAVIAVLAAVMLGVTHGCNPVAAPQASIPRNKSRKSPTLRPTPQLPQPAS